MPSRPRPRQLPKTPLALSILMLLSERPMHPYEMKRLMKERGHVRMFRLKNASLYNMVERLAALEFIRQVEVTREGRRPERTVYAITDDGREEATAFVAELMAGLPEEYPPLAAPLMFIYVLGRDKAIAALAERCARLEAEVVRVDAYQRAIREGADAWVQEASGGRLDRFPRLFVIEEEYAQAMRRAELTWLQTTVAEIRDGAIAWPAPSDLPDPAERPARPDHPGEGAP